MTKRTLLALFVFVVLPIVYFYRQFYTVTWDEEVRLHDGRIIVANLKFKYERLWFFTQYQETMLREVTLTFDAGAPYGIVKQQFNRMQPRLLNYYEGEWYGVIATRGAGDDPKLTGQDWGDLQTGHGQYPLKLTSEGFKPIPIAKFPDAIIDMSLLFEVPRQQAPQYDGMQLNLGAGLKTQLLQKYPSHPDLTKLRKPNPILPTP